MSKKKRIPLKGGAEYDALTSARKYYIYLTNSGVAKSIKRSYNKRFRKVQKEELSIARSMLRRKEKGAEGILVCPIEKMVL